MSKGTETIPLNTPIEWPVYWQILGTDCKHYFQVNEPGFGPYFKLGDEVVCPVYADTEKQVKAARREELEEAHELMNDFFGKPATDLLDKLLETPHE